MQSNSPLSRKRALQRLCALYRQGARVSAPRQLKALVIHSLVDNDEKVQRWAFNAMAQLGEPADVPLMLGPWKTSRSITAVFEAGLTALAHLLTKDDLLIVLREAEVDLDASTLMALGQQTDDFKVELSTLRLDLNTATSTQLRAATLLIGLKKAPETLFSGRFPVSDVIGDLNTHEDVIVAQYSFWATVEHPELGFNNVRVAPEHFPNLPPNVQSWAYRTLTKDGTKAVQYYEAIVGASESQHSEVREGVAVGLRDIFYDSLDVTIADWLVDEREPVVRDALLEHMATHVIKSSVYREEVLKAYREAGNGSMLRSRLEAANRDRTVALELRRIFLQTNDPDLFASMLAPTMNNTQNFNAPVAAGGISNAGTGNTGPVQIMSTNEAQAKAMPVLEQLRQALEAADAPPTAAEGAKLTNEAIASPTKGRIERLIEWLKTAKDGGEALKALGDLAVTAYDKLGALVGYLPSTV